MCWKCDNPDRSHADYLATVQGSMDQHRWAVQYVESGRPHSPWAYTVGLTRLGHAELVVTGLPVRRATAYLNAVGDYAVSTSALMAGDTFALGDEVFFDIVEVDHPSLHLRVAVDLLGRHLHALQLVWRDDRGKTPWDKGFRSGRWNQPVLGCRPDPRPTDGKRRPAT